MLWCNVSIFLTREHNDRKMVEDAPPMIAFVENLIGGTNSKMNSNL